MQNLHRPQNLNEFVGQEKIKNALSVSINSAKKRKKTLDHILLSGLQGTGKTTLASVIANEMGANIKFAHGPIIEKKSDVLSLIASISEGDILFIDEIHGINKNIEELIYSAMEDGVIDIIIGPEGDSKVMRMKLPNFTLVGATTKLNKISNPFRDRFGIVLRIPFYVPEEIAQIVDRNAKILKINIEKNASHLIAENSRRNPRIAINLLKRVSDYSFDNNLKTINCEIVHTTFNAIGIYKLGLNELHIEYLELLNDKFNNKWCSLELISGLLGESRENIEHEIEPILLENQLVAKSNKGRTITEDGQEYLRKIKAKKN